MDLLHNTPNCMLVCLCKTSVSCKLIVIIMPKDMLVVSSQLDERGWHHSLSLPQLSEGP